VTRVPEWSYILEVGSLRVQVRSESGVGVGAGVDRAIVVVVLGDHDPLGSGELLFQATDDGLLIFWTEGGGTLAHPCLIQGLACGIHGGDESFTCSRCVVAAAAWAVTVASSSLLLATAATCCSSAERLEVLPGMVGKMVVGDVNPRVRSEMSGSEEKIDSSDYHVRERCAIKN
jgi:hypothetical protein